MVGIERIEPVRVDHPDIRNGRIAAGITAWRTAVGFECFVSFGGRIYHGVSAEGTWLVLDYYPVIASGTRPSITLWDKAFYIFYTDDDAPVHLSLRLARGNDRHVLASKELTISGLPPGAKVTNLSAVRFNERWMLFFELVRGGVSEIAHAESSDLNASWTMRDVLALDHTAHRDYRPTAPVTLAFDDEILLFYSALRSDASQIWCVRLSGDPLRVASETLFAPTPHLATCAEMTGILQWGPQVYAYLCTRDETWRAVAPMRTLV